MLKLLLWGGCGRWCCSLGSCWTYGCLSFAVHLWKPSLNVNFICILWQWECWVIYETLLDHVFKNSGPVRNKETLSFSCFVVSFREEFYKLLRGVKKKKKTNPKKPEQPTQKKNTTKTRTNNKKSSATKAAWKYYILWFWGLCTIPCWFSSSKDSFCHRKRKIQLCSFHKLDSFFVCY